MSCAGTRKETPPAPKPEGSASLKGQVRPYCGGVVVEPGLVDDMLLVDEPGVVVSPGGVVVVSGAVVDVSEEGGGVAVLSAGAVVVMLDVVVSVAVPVVSVAFFWQAPRAASATTSAVAVISVRMAFPWSKWMTGDEHARRPCGSRMREMISSQARPAVTASC
jgi:hypothetical protein